MNNKIKFTLSILEIVVLSLVGFSSDIRQQASTNKFKSMVLFSEASEYEKSLEEVALKILLNLDLEIESGKMPKSEQNLYLKFKIKYYFTL